MASHGSDGEKTLVDGGIGVAQPITRTATSTRVARAGRHCFMWASILPCGHRDVSGASNLAVTRHGIQGWETSEIYSSWVAREASTMPASTALPPKACGGGQRRGDFNLRAAPGWARWSAGRAMSVCWCCGPRAGGARVPAEHRGRSGATARCRQVTDRTTDPPRATGAAPVRRPRLPAAALERGVLGTRGCAGRLVGG